MLFKFIYKHIAFPITNPHIQIQHSNWHLDYFVVIRLSDPRSPHYMFIVTLLHCTTLIFSTYITLHLHSIYTYISYIITLHLPTKITKKKKGMFHIHSRLPCQPSIHHAMTNPLKCYATKIDKLQKGSL